MIRYHIRVHDAAAHLYAVNIEIPTETNTKTDLEFAAWIPGSYLVREFARHIVGPIQAKDDGRQVNLIQTNKNAWHVSTQGRLLSINYLVYAWDFSVRAAHLDQTHGFFNGTSVFMRVASQFEAPVTLHIQKPNFAWKIATTLHATQIDRFGFGLYSADNFDELIDHPVEMSAFQELRFEAEGVPHRAVFTGQAHFDQARLANDLAKICATQIRFFEPRTRRAPFDRYLFMTQLSADGYGGLEHRSSTALHCARNDLPAPNASDQSAGYRQYLGLCSHEYFHSWNVKRIKPAAFAPYDLSRENHTGLLWIFEGFTSYYDDLLLLRAGLISPSEYLDLLAKTIARVLSEPGRFAQSVAQSSYDAWTKYYRQDENSSNSLISYYTKGSLVALCLDLTIRLQTQGRKSLDDVMRLMWQRAKQNIYLGENDFPSWVLEATGCNLRSEINRWAYKPGDLPVQELLKSVGVSWQAVYESAPSLGAKCVQRGADLVAATVYVGSTASKAGLSAHDIIVAADNLRMNDTALKALLARKKVGDKLSLTVFRRDQLHTFTVKLSAPALQSIKLSK
jgi:predicted metalloprotease with PDZ domain